jgi:nicotinamide riboside kinase
MKIGISGVSSTGKSTLSREVSALSGFNLLSDVDLHKQAFDLLTEQGKTPSTKYFPGMTKLEHINFEKAIHSCRTLSEFIPSQSKVVYDESPLDFINYYYAVCAAHPDLLDSKMLEAMVQEMWHHLGSYDLIVYLPFNSINVEEDGRRFTNKPLLTFWDLSLKSLVNKASEYVWVEELNTNVFEERVKSVMQFIDVLNTKEN